MVESPFLVFFLINFTYQKNKSFELQVSQPNCWINPLPNCNNGARQGHRVPGLDGGMDGHKRNEPLMGKGDMEFIIIIVIHHMKIKGKQQGRHNYTQKEDKGII